MDFQAIRLSGENLEFYKNIEYLRELTAHARALLSRSNTVYKDILQSHELRARATAVENEDAEYSLESLQGRCFKCGIVHGANGFCILELIMKEEALRDNEESERNAASFRSVAKDVDETPHPEFSSQERVEKWEGLLHQKMTPDQLYNEYSRICHVYGFPNGQQFLYARSMARKSADKVTQGVQGFKVPTDSSFVKSDCIPQARESVGPSSKLTSKMLDKVATVMNRTPSHIFDRECKVWKNAIRAPRNFAETYNETSDFGSYESDQSCYNRVGDSGKLKYPHSPPQIRCELSSDWHNNYLDTIRRKIKRRRQRKAYSKMSASLRTDDAIISSKLINDSDLLTRSAQTAHFNHLKRCLGSAVGAGADESFDKQVSKLADLTVFTKIDSHKWDQWAYRYEKQVRHENDDDEAGDSDISSGDENRGDSSSTEQELRELKLPQSSIPYAKETIQLANNLFGRITAKLQKSILKSSVSTMLFPHKSIFFTRFNEMMLWNCTTPEAAGIFKKHKNNYVYLKALTPMSRRRYTKTKRLEANKKRLFRTQKKRRRIECIQTGKRYRPAKKSANFTKKRGYIGFKPVERALLQKPISERFPVCVIGNLGKDMRLSKEKIHHHYRLLRRLFDEPSHNQGDSLMDPGMEGRLQKFRARLANSLQDQHEAVPKGVVRSSWRKEAPNSTRKIRKNQSKMRTAVHNLNLLGLIASAQKSETDEDNISLNSDAKSQSDVSIYHSPSHMVNEGESIPRRTSMSNRMTDFGPAKSPRRKSCNQSKTFRLPTPPLSDSSRGESNNETISHRVPRKEERHIEQSARGSFHKRTGREARDYIPKEEVRPPNPYLQNSPTDDSSDSYSYVPNLLKLPSRAVRRKPGNDKTQTTRIAHTKGTRRQKFSASSSSDAEHSDSGERANNVSRERPAWNRTPCVYSHKMYSQQGEGVGSRPDSLQKDLSRLERTHFHGNQHSPEFRGLQLDRSHSKKDHGANRETLCSEITGSSLPKPPSDGICRYQPTVPSGRQFRSESTHPTIRGASDSFARPFEVITERLLKAGNLREEPSKRQSTWSRNTPERTIPSARDQSTSPRSLSSTVTRVVSGHAKFDDSVLEPVRSSVQKRQDTSASGTILPGRQSTVNLTNSSLRPEGFSGSMRISSKPRMRSSQFSEVFRKRSVFEESREMSGKFPLDKGSFSKTRIGDPSKSQQPESITSVSRKLQKVAMIGPTKKKCFDLDIGQGINCVRFLKENAPGADEKRKSELVDLLTTPIEEKRAAARTEKDLSFASSSASKKAPGPGSAQGSRSVSSYHIGSDELRFDQPNNYDYPPTKKMQFKTLDDIFKDVHGINKRNTPEILLENSYEFETHKKQQLTKHRIN